MQDAPAGRGAARGAQAGPAVIVYRLRWWHIDDVLPIEHLTQHRHAFVVRVPRQGDGGVPADIGHFVLQRGAQRRHLRVTGQRSE